MDAGWAARHAATIFPMESQQSLWFDAAWNAYLGGGRFTDEAWGLLTTLYAAAVDQMDLARQGTEHEAAASQLGGDLVSTATFDVKRQPDRLLLLGGPPRCRM